MRLLSSLSGIHKDMCYTYNAGVYPALFGDERRTVKAKFTLPFAPYNMSVQPLGFYSNFRENY